MVKVINNNLRSLQFDAHSHQLCNLLLVLLFELDLLALELQNPLISLMDNPGVLFYFLLVLFKLYLGLVVKALDFLGEGFFVTYAARELFDLQQGLSKFGVQRIYSLLPVSPLLEQLRRFVTQVLNRFTMLSDGNFLLTRGFMQHIVLLALFGFEIVQLYVFVLKSPFFAKYNGMDRMEFLIVIVCSYLLAFRLHIHKMQRIELLFEK